PRAPRGGWGLGTVPRDDARVCTNFVPGLMRTIADLKRGLVVVAVLLVAVPAAAPARIAAPATDEVVVTLRAPALAELHARTLAGVAGRRLNLHAAQSASYLRELATAHRA